jgi:hypothetical protein
MWNVTNTVGIEKASYLWSVAYTIENMTHCLAQIKDQGGHIVAFFIRAATKEWYIFDKDHNYIKLAPSKTTSQGLRRYATYIRWQKGKNKNTIAQI